MNKLIKVAKAVVLVWMVSAPVLAWASRGYIYDAGGTVTVAAGNEEPRPALKYDTVTSGVVIRTGGDSHAVLKFEDGQVVSLQANSTFLVREYIYNPQQAENSNIIFSLFKGGMRFISGQIGRLNPKSFRLATPNATIGIRGTDFLVVLANDGLYDQVLSGSITVTNEAGMSVFTAGNSALTASPTTLPVKISPTAVPADTFSQLGAIAVPAPLPGEIPDPVLPVPVSPSAEVTEPASEVLTSTGTENTYAGGAAEGSAAGGMPAAVAVPPAGFSGTAITVGIGVAVGVALIANTTSTTHH